MSTIKYFNQDKDNFITTLLVELKVLGVKVPKRKRFKSFVSKLEKSTNQNGMGKIFGVSLSEQEWISNGDLHLPKFLALSTAYLQNFSNKEIGLFRKAGNIARQKKLRARLEQGETLEDSEPNDVASLLKQWLRELSEPLVPQHLQELFIRCLQLEEEESQVTACLLACLLLLPDHLQTLKHLLHFLADIAFKRDKNKMDAHNLALIMAPNIFGLHETSDKVKNNFVQHAEVMKILIENCNKVGEIPESVAFQQLCPSSELDSSSDMLDSASAKSKKKHKNDIFSGIKKLVGQNGTPVSKNVTTDLKTPSGSKFVSKRKADPDTQSSSTIKNKKPALSFENLSNPSLSVTPKIKGILTNDTDRKVCGHVRRKSIGALLRRKRGKSSKFSQNQWQTEDQLRKCPASNLFDKNSKVSDVESPTHEFVYSHEKTVPQSTPGSIKKSISDCYLPTVNMEFPMHPALTVSSSQGSLPKQPKRASSYNLRSEKFNFSQIGEATVLDSDQSINSEKKRKQIKCQKKDSFRKQPDNTDKNFVSYDRNFFFSDTENKYGETLLVLRGSHKNPNKFKKEEPSANSLSSKIRSPILNTCSTYVSVYNDTALPTELKNEKNISNKKTASSSKTEHVQDTWKDSRNCIMKRQEAFIVKSIKASPTSSGSLIKSFDYDTPESQNKNHKLEKNYHERLNNIKHDTNKSTSDRKNLKRKTRHGSLIRGRPNSINNGLQAALPHRNHHDWSVISNSSPNLSSRDDVFTYDESQFLKSPMLESLDLSLNALLQGITLFSPGDYSTATPTKDLCDDKNNLNSGQSTSPKGKKYILEYAKPDELESTDKLTPLMKSRKRLSRNSEGKASNSKNRTILNKDCSFIDEQSNQRSQRDSLKPQEGETDCQQNINENISSNISPVPLLLNDSCFKTPNNKISSPDSVVWTSGGKFLSSLSPPSDEVYNKRESIAMILKNKTGHVQAKVDLYDKHLCKSSASAGKNQLRDEKLMRASSQKCYSAGRTMKVSKTKSFGLENRSHSVKSKAKFQMSPLPPPPKFTLTDLFTPSPKINHPLKEVTNISLNAEDFKSSFSPNKSQKSNTPAKCANDSLILKGTPHSGSKAKKASRNSFSGQTPYKLRKKVSRSESSPACRRKVILHE